MVILLQQKNFGPNVIYFVCGTLLIVARLIYSRAAALALDGPAGRCRHPGPLPGSFLKVAVVKRLIACRRVLYLLWLDSDAIIRPILLATKAHGKQDEALSFMSLADIFEKFAMAPSTAFLGYKEPSDSASG